jgi:hypothetical protein
MQAQFCIASIRILQLHMYESLSIMTIHVRSRLVLSSCRDIPSLSCVMCLTLCMTYHVPTHDMGLHTVPRYASFLVLVHLVVLVVPFVSSASCILPQVSLHSSAAAVHLQHVQAAASPLLINDAYSEAFSSAAREAQMELCAVFPFLAVACAFWLFCLLRIAPTCASQNFCH